MRIFALLISVLACVRRDSSPVDSATELQHVVSTIPHTRLAAVEGHIRSSSSRSNNKQDSVGAKASTHEPANMTLIHNWDGHNQGAWLTADGKPIRQLFAYDSALADTVMVQTYGPWRVPDKSTWGPGHLYFTIPNALRPIYSFYLRAQIMLSPNWQQPPGVGDQKLFQMFPGTGHGYNVGLILVGATGRIRYMAYEVNGHDARYNGIPLGQNPRGKSFIQPPPDLFTLGRWHTVEALIVGNTSGLPNGRIVTWLDGRMQTDVGDMLWASAGENGSFFQFDLNSLWGGQGGTLAAAQYMYVGKIHLSGSAETNAVSPR